MLKLKEDLKNGIFRQAYLLQGEEAYLKKMYKDRLMQALCDPTDTMNVSRYEGKGINTKEIIDLAETMPFFAERRVILLENSGFFKTSTEDLAEYLSQIPETCSIVFVENEVDKRGKLFKAVKALGGVAEFRVQEDEVLARWILQTLRKEKLTISGHNLQFFMTRTGTSMENIDRELEKLICYVHGRTEITQEDIEAVCCGQTTNQIFKMVDAIAQKDQKRALELYYDLLALKEPPMRILFLVVRQFHILLQVKSLSKKGYDRKTIAAKAGVPEFTLRKSQEQAKRFDRKALLRAVELGIQSEEDVKTGRMGDQMAVELLIIACSK